MAIDADLDGVIANVRNGVGHWKRMATRLARTLAEPQARSGTGRTERRAAATSGPKYRHDRTVTSVQGRGSGAVQAVAASASQLAIELFPGQGQGGVDWRRRGRGLCRGRRASRDGAWPGWLLSADPVDNPSEASPQTDEACVAYFDGDTPPGAGPTRQALRSPNTAPLGRPSTCCMKLGSNEKGSAPQDV